MNQKQQTQWKWKGVIWIVLALVLVSGLVSASVTITGVTAPSRVLEGETLEVSFTAETDENESLDYQIFIEDELKSSSSSYVWNTNYTDAGYYKFEFFVSTTNSSDSEIRYIEVTNDPLDLSIISPDGGDISSSTVSILVESKHANECEYNLNSTGTGMLTKNGIEYTKDVSVVDGSHRLEVTCRNGFETKTETVVFETDGNPPIVLSSGPNNPYSDAIKEDYATLMVTTNEIANCKFDTSDSSYNSMDNTFFNTNSKTHYSEISGLGQGEHTYYVRCEDSAGNKMSSSEIIVFFTNLKPTAIVSIDGNSPLKAGTYNVKLTTSEEMIGTPTLEYNFHNSQTRRPISLIGSDREWEGYMIIEELTSDSVGTFFFQGVDTSSLGGSTITSGKLFLVDTTKPGVVDSFKVEQIGNRLRLEWHYDKDDVEKYNIYKSLDSGVSYTDFYVSTDENFVEDSDVDEGVTYFYKIAVEDEAGNEGSLSEQKEGIIEPGLKNNEPLSPVLAARVDQKIKAVNSFILDADLSINNLEGETDPEKVDAIFGLGLVNKARAIKTNLEGLRNELENLKIQDLSDGDLGKILTKLDSSISTQTSNVIDSVEIRDKLEFEQSFDEGEFRKSLNEFALYKNLEADKDFVDLSFDIQDKITINAKIMGVNLHYLSGNRVEELTLISKIVLSSETLPMVSIVETIPKIVEDNADDITFSKTPRILKKDPVVEWEFTDFSSQSFHYVINDAITISDAKNVRTDVFMLSKSALPQISEEVTNNSEDNDITGLVYDEPTGGSGWSIVFLILGTITIAGLLVYYFFFLNEDGSEIVVAPQIVKNRLSSKSSSMSKISSFINDKKDVSFPTHLGELIVRANNEADQMNFTNVYKLYLSIRHLYTAEEFSSDFSKAQARAEISKIYSKIMLFSKLRTCNSLLEKNDCDGLSKELESVSNILRFHEGETSYFYSYSKMLYDHLSISSIGLGHISRK
ncbi:MAG: hypothetical protein ABH828_03510 [archaeon]